MSLAVLLSVVLSVSARQQMPPVGIIDFYGRHQVPEQQLRIALAIREGDSLPRSGQAAQLRLEAVAGVERARLNLVCCEDGKTILYVGIQEKGAAPTLRFRAPPPYDVRVRSDADTLPAPMARRLSDDIVQLGEAFDLAHVDAVRRGVVGDDHSRGYSLMEDSAARAIQLQFVSVANRDLPRLLDVLRNSPNEKHRALAAQIIAYADNRQAVTAALAEAVLDSTEGVRNNAVRALAILALHAQSSAEALGVPHEPLVDLLSSLVWTDRNKASLALWQLTEKRDATLLALLRTRAFESLADIARWKAPGHAQPGFFIVGRIAGLTDQEIFAAWQRGDREVVIAAARRR